MITKRFEHPKDLAFQVISVAITGVDPALKSVQRKAEVTQTDSKKSAFSKCRKRSGMSWLCNPSKSSAADLSAALTLWRAGDWNANGNRFAYV